MRRGRLVAAAIVALLAVAAVAFLLPDAGLADVRATVTSAGPWAPLLFLLLQSTVTIVPVPRTVFTVAAGVLFGSSTGLVLTIAATAIAATVAFWLVRLVGREFVERHSHRHGVAWLRARLDHRGLLAIVSLRMIPAVPFAVLNYTAGLAGVRFPSYLLGTVLGVLPGTVAIVVLGDAAVGGHPHPAMLGVSVLCGAIGVTGAVAASRRLPAETTVPESKAPES